MLQKSPDAKHSNRLQNYPKLLIAAVNGAAIGWQYVAGTDPPCSNANVFTELHNSLLSVLLVARSAARGDKMPPPSYRPLDGQKTYSVHLGVYS